MLDHARSQGLAARSVDGYAGEISLPATHLAPPHNNPARPAGYAGVLCHLDVVAAGDGWTVPPFALTRKDGLLLGRGVSDDKGPAVATLHCLLALRDLDRPRTRELRLLLGTDEERGMAGIAHYFRYNPRPAMAFTPDAYYPVINAEKALARFSLRSRGTGRTLQRAALPFQVTGIASGDALNLVPSRAQVRLSESGQPPEGNNNRAGAAQSHAALVAAVEHHGEGMCGVSRGPEGLAITGGGAQAHSAYPELGDNAATRCLRLLSRLSSLVAVPADVLALAGLASGPADGAALGMAGSDAVSGATTVSLARLRWEQGKLEADFDARVHVSADLGALERRVRERASAHGLNLVSLGSVPALHVPADHPVIGPLQEAYASVTGRSAELGSTGGATYARSLGGTGVAFGAAMPGSDYRQHRADEAVPESDFLLHLRICTEALDRLSLT